MKRLNPKTGVPFVRWDTRDEDDLVFCHYTIKGDYYSEYWVTFDEMKRIAKMMSDQRREHERKNRGKPRARTAKRLAADQLRKPRWIKDVFEKEIQEIYQMASELEKIFPWKMHVDHVVPKQGKLVSGLHVPWNLEILPWITNIKKGNKFDVNAEQPPSLPEGTYRKGKVYTQLGFIPTSWIREDNNHPNHHSGAVRGQDADYSTQEGSGDSMGHGGEEMGTSEALESQQDTWELNPAYGWIERTG
jgi:5-methylcytosine-specific restriction endonuclease McrA